MSALKKALTQRGRAGTYVRTDFRVSLYSVSSQRFCLENRTWVAALFETGTPLCSLARAATQQNFSSSETLTYFIIPACVPVKLCHG